jgi:ATP-binding cassette subfamily F protein 3
MESVEWLEAFLRNQNIPMVIVSHDREFLDQVCTKIVDAEGGICNEYDGNYSRFLDLKKARMDAWQASYDAQEKKMKEERAWINKFKVKQPQAVKQRKAQLEKKMASDDYVKRPPTFGKPFRFRFPDAPRLSPEVRTYLPYYISFIVHHPNVPAFYIDGCMDCSVLDGLLYSHLVFRLPSPPLFYILIS